MNLSFWRELLRKISNANLETKLFIAGFLFLGVFKLWLVHTEEIYGREAQHDEIWFLTSAAHWYWWRPYDWAAFARPPAYPLFIAVVHQFGIPLRIGIELVQLAGYGALIAGLRRAGLPRVLAILSFALLLLHPVSFQRNNYAGADTFYAALLAFVLAGFLFIWVSQNKIPHAIWTGAAIAVLWVTRDESTLLPPLIIGFGILAFYLVARDKRTRPEIISRVLVPAGALIATLILVLCVFYTANYRTFGAFAACEIVSPGFRAAHRALLRIKPSRTIRFVAVTNEALQLAYQVSPTFSKLRPEFEGQLGRDWQQETLSTYGIRNEIGAGWFRWALRALAGHAGFHQNATQADHFYRQVAREVNDACDRGQIPSRRVFSDFFDPAAFGLLCHIPDSFIRNVARFKNKYSASADRADWNLNMEQSEFYDEMANRRAALTRFGKLQIIGWAFQFGDPLKLVFFRDEGGRIWGSTVRFSARPDVAAQFQEKGNVGADMQFVLTIDTFRKAIPFGDLVFITRSGAEFSGPIASVLGGTAPTSDGTPLMYSIDSNRFLVEGRPISVAAENFIGRYYASFVVFFSIASLAALALFIFYYRRLRWEPFNAWLLLLQLAILSRLLLFSFVDATSWHCVDERFLLPIMPLYSCFLVVLFYQAMRLVRPSLGEKTITPG